ncbi:hypothetical protein TREES_T100021105 [Tupaia chinensis]|uniref:UBZ2-type domain-containing protein n=1 Tax=Tupaia chinensis TaxID=246437 RepID=L8YCL4_TUPCH|nr:hypothetical protein TREES_T100021105 [Tupaia chinensis]
MLPRQLSEGSDEREQLWADLLRTARADLTPDGELPPLPTFPDQEPRHSPECTESPEVFTMGSKTFSWMPFPPAPRGPGDSRLLCALGEPSGSPAGPSQGQPVPDAGGTPSGEQLSVEGTSTLQSCPMCQKEFHPGLAQLDMDSHLAQCLAESTEDLVW